MLGIFLGLIVFATGALFLQAIRRIPAQPPTIAVCTELGERTGKIKKEGWRLFFLYPWLFGFIPVDITKKNKDLIPKGIRTPDMAEIEIEVSVTWQPDPDASEETGKTNLIEYLNSGGEEGVNNILSDIIEESVREMAINPDEEPFTWENAVKMKKEFIAKIIVDIVGKGTGRTTSENLKDIEDQLRVGNGNIKLPKLGIRLNRVNVTNIHPKGELAKAAEQKAKEERERDAEEVELRHVRNQIKELNLLGFSNEQALEVIQTERGKVIKEIKESKWNVSQETRAMIEKIGPEIVGKILLWRKNDNDRKNK